MDKKKIINYGLVLSIVVILGFILYFNILNNKKHQDQEVLSGNQNQEQKDEIAPESKNTNSSLNTTNNSESFNNVMKLAQQALIKKDYLKSLEYYNIALSLEKSDVVYSGMFNVYSAQGNWTKALEVLDQAINLSPRYTDYWIWKIGVLDEKTNTTFQELNSVYHKGFDASMDRTRINLVTYFARIAENNNEKIEAINLWTKAIQLNPDMKSVYQTEIDRLNK